MSDPKLALTKLISALVTLQQTGIKNPPQPPTAKQEQTREQTHKP